MASTSYANYPIMKFPLSDLIDGPKDHYLRIRIPLYEASIKCDWKAAKAIFDQNKNLQLVKCSITDNGETALHVAASAKGPKKVEEFVKNLVGIMEPEDLELVNKNQNTALYLAAAAGNIETVKIMMAKNSILDKIAGCHGSMMPLYAGALFGNKDVVKFLYENSNDLSDDDGWNPRNRSWLLEKCVESDMFDVARLIVKKYPELGRSSILLQILARKPHAFSNAQAKSGIVKRTNSPDVAQQIVENYPELGRSNTLLGILARKAHAFSKTLAKSGIVRRFGSSVSAFFVGEPEKETEALQLLRIIWGDILTMNKGNVDDILRGPMDLVKPANGWVLQVIQLEDLISEQLEEMGKTYPKEHQVPQLKKLISQYVLKMHTETQNIIKEENNMRSSKGGQALELEKIISENIVKLQHDSRKFVKPEAGEKYLQDLISNHISHMRRATRLKETYSNRVAFVAANKGNTKFLVELIRGYHDLIWKADDNNQTIFHVAIKNRHEGIYNVLYEIGAMKDMVTPLIDKDGNSMLHLAAMSTRKKNLEDVSGAALQMQRELLWFMEVERMVPPSYRERPNNDGLTPRELFTMEHQDLITQGEKWMKATASQCMVVVTLIATIVFAAAFTVPGGYNQNDGIPMFKQKLSFVAFVVADAISLFLSSASILTFLSILTSRYAERDFERSLPMKLMAGLAALFLSVGTMMITFSVSFFVLYHKEMKWIPIFISLFAVTPAILYVALQYHLLIDVFRSTYGGKYLFKPANQVLFYEHPKY